MEAVSGTEDTQALVSDPLAATEAVASASRTPGPGSGGAFLRRGAVVGRHVVIRELGAGGMGVVYAAYDPELDRRVALKRLLPGRSVGREGRERLLREAQAMARLSHPNVVAIHDVGEHEGAVWLAMEFVDGVTLGAWLKAQRRSWRAVLEVLVAAGQGLAAAHAAGILHRDFKPDNVMVGDDGRVRVMDLGLARASGASGAVEAAARAEGSAASGAEISKLALQVTQAGAVLGTPAYMAPEQFRGQDVDARADVWAYCVTLWEALYGARPFAGDSMVRLAANVLAGKIEAPPRDRISRSVPRWLRRLCERGLAVDAAKRPASLPELLAAFERGRRRSRAARGAAGIVALALVVGGAAGWRRWDEHQRIAACERDGAEIDAVWNDEARAALREGLLATGVSYAATTAERTIPYFDAQARRWREARTEVCLDTRVRRLWTDELLARARWCLEERRMEFEALASELTRASAKTVQKAVTAAAALGEVEPCRSGPRLQLLPGPPEAGADVATVTAALSHAGALLAAGDYEPGLEVARAAISRAEALQWPPLVARARRIAGRIEMEKGDFEGAEATLAEAYFGAAQAGEWGTAAVAATDLVYAVGYRMARYAEGRAWGRHAEVALSVTYEGEDGLRRADLRNNLASLLEAAGDYEASKSLHERALAARERALGPAHPRVANSLNNFANLALATGDYAEAKALLRRAVALREEAQGADHPLVASSLGNLAVAYEALGEYEEARGLYERARAIQEAALDADHPDLGATLNNLGSLHVALGEYEEARRLYTRSLAIREAAFGAEHPLVGESLHNLGEVARSTGALEEANVLHLRGLAIREKGLGPDHPLVGESLYALAIIALERGAFAEARSHLERARVVTEEGRGPDHPVVAYMLTGLARVGLAEGRPADALALVDRALRIREASGAPAGLVADSRFILARALWEASEGRDRARARVEARRAADSFRAEGAGKAQALAEVESWLAEREGDSVDAAAP